MSNYKKMTQNSTPGKFSFFNVIAIVSSVGIVAWIITDFFGGMMLWLFSYWFVFLPIILLYIGSFFESAVTVIRDGKKRNEIKLYSHLSVIGVILLFNLYHSEVFKAKSILTATLKDDLYHYTLIFRENGKVENHASGIFGYTETFEGDYFIVGDTIIFTKKPYDNNFIPDTLLLDKSAKAIFIEKDEHEQFVTEKKWLNHFEID